MTYTNTIENLEKLEVLSEIYNDLKNSVYTTRKDLDVAKLKMKLVKKEMLLLNHMINKEVSLR
ncbi:hypothetical protein HN789_00950 [archaeon]|jgi:hypothetical protein|nr:hypothetical protein [archaeon]MBT4022096.1 hypothetical protein [archaeon]MBT4272709.1 hypothetical protein [archaeon]MBT4461508.1 hypothetical protein [archaeon]MBT4857723.1 hypothetical protein [archaeon]